MSYYSYPRLATADASDLLLKFNETVRTEIAELGRSYRGRATTYATGLRIADDAHLEAIRKEVLDLASRHGYPHAAPNAGFDQALPRLLGNQLKLSPAEAGRPEVWNYLTLVLLPDVALWRWPNSKLNPSYERLIGKPRNFLRRHWWRWRLLGDDLPELLNEDELVQIVERSATLGGDPRVARVVASEFRAFVDGHRLEGQGARDGLKRMALMRDVTKRVLRLGRVVVLSTLSEADLRSLVCEVLRQSANRQAEDAGASLVSVVHAKEKQPTPSSTLLTFSAATKPAQGDESARERALNQAMVRLYERAELEVGVNVAGLRRSLADFGGLATARRMLASDEQDWFRELAHHGRLDLTVESVVLSPDVSSLFSSAELKIARGRLSASRAEARQSTTEGSVKGGAGEDVQRRFKAAMVEIYDRCRSEVGYNPTAFIRMVSNVGPLETAIRLVSSPRPSEGFVELWTHDRLDLTVETLVVDPEFSQLFDDEVVARAKQRLKEYGR